MKWNFKDREPAHRLFQDQTRRSKFRSQSPPARTATNLHGAMPRVRRRTTPDQGSGESLRSSTGTLPCGAGCGPRRRDVPSPRESQLMAVQIVMDRTGDSRYLFDPASPAQVAEA